VLPPLPEPWRAPLTAATRAPSFAQLREFLDEERRRHAVLPDAEDTFRALELVPPERVSVVILGQDPYPTPGHAHGLAFSVRPEVKPLPPSLRNLFRERDSDLGIAPSASGDLSAWARQGVLLLNTVLTVRAGEARSHKGRGWEEFTDAVIDRVAASRAPSVFVLWGADAQMKRGRIDETRHTVIASVHPSPLSAHRGFFGSRPYSRINEALLRADRRPIAWG
jgi:uracil-DNA glycosylase